MSDVRYLIIKYAASPDTGGSGLGFSIVKNAVLLREGNIVAKNRPEFQSTRFIADKKNICVEPISFKRCYCH